MGGGVWFGAATPLPPKTNSFVFDRPRSLCDFPRNLGQKSQAREREAPFYHEGPSHFPILAELPKEGKKKEAFKPGMKTDCDRDRRRSAPRPRPSHRPPSLSLLSPLSSFHVADTCITAAAARRAIQQLEGTQFNNIS